MLLFHADFLSFKVLYIYLVKINTSEKFNFNVICWSLCFCMCICSAYRLENMMKAFWSDIDIICWYKNIKCQKKIMLVNVNMLRIVETKHFSYLAVWKKMRLAIGVIDIRGEAPHLAMCPMQRDLSSSGRIHKKVGGRMTLN